MTRRIAAIITGAIAVMAAAVPAAAQRTPPRFEAPPAGKGQVVFFRRGLHSDNLWGTCPIRERAGESARPVMKLGKDRYAAFVVDPGLHRYFTKTEVTDSLTLEVEAGQTYFVRCELATSGFALQPADLKPATQVDFDRLAPKLKPAVVPPR